MSMFKVTLLVNDDKLLPYVVTTESDTEESAIRLAKEFVANNGWFPSFLTATEIINSLTVYEVTKIDEEYKI